jgi:HD-GYP domain-containing protein (c-di-GMP phosphodiesterase class II)
LTEPVNAPAPMRPSTQASVSFDPQGDAFVRRSGRALVLAMYSALRAIKLYPVENAAVEKALDDLAKLAQELAAREGELEIKVSGEFLFVNSVRLRLELDNYASFSHLLGTLLSAGVGGIGITPEAGRRDWLILLSLLQSSSRDAPPARFRQLTGKLEQAGVSSFEISEPSEADEESREKTREVAKRTYAQSVAVTKELMTSVRIGKSPNIKKIKRVVQGIVDQILNEETSLVGLTTLRDYDEYTFTHSVNVCIFAVALGKRLGLSKLQLYDLGIAALFHDIGKSRVPLEVLNKAGGLTDTEWRLIAAHPWLGVLALFGVRGQQELPYRAMVVAYEHHMKVDVAGYPQPVRPRALSMFSKIVAVADGFDAATSRRTYQTVPLSPSDVLVEMRDNPRRGMDPVVVKGFINLTGIYPPGTVVVLDTFELAIVHGVNPVPEMLSRPIVRIVSDEMGNILFPGIFADLAEQDENGVYRRTIIKTENAEKYGIRVGDYFV